jgi:hypothetical protein
MLVLAQQPLQQAQVIGPQHGGFRVHELFLPRTSFVTLPAKTPLLARTFLRSQSVRLTSAAGRKRASPDMDSRLARVS